MKQYKIIIGSLITSFLIFVSSIAIGQRGWEHEYPGDYYWKTQPIDLITTQDNGFFVGGSSIDFSLVDFATFLARVDLDGDLIWLESYDSLGDVMILSIEELPSGGAIFLYAFSQYQDTIIHVAATAANGQLIWSQNYVSLGQNNGRSQSGLDILKTSDGNYVFFTEAGTVFKITESGTLLWTQETYDPSTPQPFYPNPFGNAIHELPNGAFVLNGTTIIDIWGSHIPINNTAVIIDSLGVVQRTILDSTNTKGMTLVKTASQELVFCGEKDFLTGDSLILTKTDYNLNILWRKSYFLGINNPVVLDIEERSNGDLWCLVFHETTIKLLKFDFNGNYLGMVLNLSSQNNTTYLPSYYEKSTAINLVTMEPTSDGGMLLMFSENLNTKVIKLDSLGNPNPSIEGFVYADTNSNCIQNNGEVPFQYYIVEAQRTSDNAVFYGTTDVDGRYYIPIDTGTYNVSIPSLFYWQACSSPPPVLITSNVKDTVDFGLQPLTPCSLVRANISVSQLRATWFSSYSISYRNEGTAMALNTQLEVELDPLVHFINASQPIINQNGNAYTFNIDSLEVGESGQFYIQVIVDSSAQIGQTHCSSVHVYPDTVCLPNFWNGPIVDVTGDCQNDTVFFNIRNTGAPMGTAFNYYVFEDHVMMRTGTFQLGAGANTIVAQPAALGKTYRLSGDQAAGFPPILGNSLATAVVEGCLSNTNGSFNLGFVNQFANGSSSPFHAVDCTPNRASFDPNDKTAQPEGYQSQHYIDTTTILDYRIRFQNTGTDTAFHITIKDTLSPYLDHTSIIMGSSSHPYTWRLMDNGALKVMFSKIMLVDSTTNEPLSHGFFQYQIQQKNNNPIGAIIENSASIYFDFNAPILTNTTFHTVGENFIEIILLVEEVLDNKLDIKVYPNPFNDFTTIEINGQEFQELTLRVFDLAGRELQFRQAKGSNQIKLPRGNLQQGLYIYQLEGDQQLISTGKIVVQLN